MKEFGYIGTYFEHRQEEDEDIDQDGYIKGGEGRGSDSETRRRGTRTAAMGAWRRYLCLGERGRKMDVGRRRNSGDRDLMDREQDEAQVANAAHHHALNQSTDGNAHPVSSCIEMMKACSQRPWRDL